MADNKITLPTIVGNIECDISFSRETPEDAFSLFNFDVSITPMKINNYISFEKDPFVDIHVDSNNQMHLGFRLSYINTKKSELVEDEEYFYLKIIENVRVPKNVETALKVIIDASFAKILFKEKPSKEEIIKRLRLEMASNQTIFNPNADGRFPRGTIYGWGGTS